MIDEADRMMADTKLEWLPEVEQSVYDRPTHDLAEKEMSDNNKLKNETKYRTSRSKPGVMTFGRLSAIQIPLQKILLSATLSEDPERLHQLNLFQPKLFTVESDRITQENPVDG